MFDTIDCKYPLPDFPPGASKNSFQTKSFGDGFVGGFMDNYTIEIDGQLIFHKATYEMVPEKDRPYYGTPEWETNTLVQLCGAMKSVPLGDEKSDYTGTVSMLGSVEPLWIEYDLEFVAGKVVSVKKIYMELGK